MGWFEVALTGREDRKRDTLSAIGNKMARDAYRTGERRNRHEERLEERNWRQDREADARFERAQELQERVASGFPVEFLSRQDQALLATLNRSQGGYGQPTPQDRGERYNSGPELAAPARSNITYIRVGDRDFGIIQPSSIAPENRDRIADALQYIDERKNKDSADSINAAFNAGLDPNATIQIGRGRTESLQHWVLNNTHSDQGATNQAFKDARDALQSQRDAEASARRQAAEAAQETQAVQQGRQPDFRTFCISELGLTAANLKDDSANLDTPEVRAAFGRMLRADALTTNTEDQKGTALTPEAKNKLLAKIVAAANTPEKRQELLNSIDKANVTAAELKKSGVDLSGLTEEEQNLLTRVMNLNAKEREAALVQRQQNTFGMEFPLEDVRAVKLKDAAQQKLLDEAIAKQEKWAKMAEESGVMGFIMMLFKPLLEAFTPNSDPEVIIARNANGGISEAPQSVIDALKQHGKNVEAIHVVAGAPATAEVPPAATDKPAAPAIAATLDTNEIKAFEQLLSAHITGPVRNLSVDGTIDTNELAAIKSMTLPEGVSAELQAALAGLKGISDVQHIAPDSSTADPKSVAALVEKAVAGKSP